MRSIILVSMLLVASVAEAHVSINSGVPSLAKVEREHIERILQECNGNISRAARVLGMHRRTLQYKLAKFPAKR